MLKHVQLMLNTYQGRFLAGAGVVVGLGAAFVTASSENTHAGRALLILECLVAMVGMYLGSTLRSHLDSSNANILPHFKERHLAMAFGLDFLVVVIGVAGTSIIGASTLWSDVSQLRLFALLWGWSLLWIAFGHFFGEPSELAFIIPFFVHAAALRFLPDRFEPYLWSLVEKPFSASDVLLLVATGALAALLVYDLRRRHPAEEINNVSAPKDARYDVRRMGGDGPGSRILHMKRSLKSTSSVIMFAAYAALFLFVRFRQSQGAGPFGGFETPFGPLYLLCCISCFSTIHADAFGYGRVTSVFQLPFRRQDIVRDYGLALLLAHAERFLWFVLAAGLVYLVPLPGIPQNTPTIDVALYCFGILLVTFGLATLFASWTTRLLPQHGAIAVMVLYASVLDTTLVSPVVSVLIGITLIAAAYYRWCNVELDGKER